MAKKKGGVESKATKNIEQPGTSNKKLNLDLSSSSEDEHDEPIKINEKFATSYESWRRKEEIARLKSKYGDADDLDKAWTSDEDEGNRVYDSSGSDSDSDSDSSTDERIAQEQIFDKQFFKCYSALKKRDEKIYDKQVKFFDDPSTSSPSDDDEKSSQVNKKITKPKMTLLDYHIKLATGLEADTPEDQMSSNLMLDKRDKSHYEKELDEIKSELKRAEGSSDDDDDDLFIRKKPKTEASVTEKHKAEKKVVVDEEIANDEDLSYLKDFWHKENKELDEREKFLRDFILNKKYLNDQEDVEEATDEKADEFFSKNVDDVTDGFKSEDDEIEKNNPVSKVKKSKFHSEEKNADQIQRIPRNVTATIRDLERQQIGKEKREARRERKKKEKRDELNRLKLFQKQEMEEKLQKIRKISGDPEISMEDVAETLDGDKEFDFDRHPVPPCEDIVAGIPTKFKYRSTVPNDFGLSNEELLMATDQELNRWVSLKKTSQYRSEDQELFDKKAYDQKRNNLKLKEKIFTSIYSSKEDDQKEKEGEEEKPEEDSEQVQKKAKKKKHKRGVNHKKTKCGVPEERLLAYGISKKKLKKSKLL